MAMASWANASPNSGSGNGSVNISSKTTNTGRAPRGTTAAFKAAGVMDENVSVLQAGKPEFIDVQDTASAAQGGATVTIPGMSNSGKLTFTLGTGSLAIALPANYLANSVTTPNGAAIAGDPGGSAEFPFSLQVVVPENAGVEELARQIVVTDEAGNTDVCTITQAAGEPTLEVSHSTVELDWQGTPVTVTVTSNTNWTVE